jgi:hypothetical protein
MTLDECDEMLEALQRTGVEVRAVEFAGAEWKIYCWHPNQEHGRWVCNARRYRKLVRMGLIPGMPKDAFDKQPRRKSATCRDT